MSPRPYLRHGHGLVAKARPYLVERVADETIPDDALTPVERAARDWRSDALADLGGAEAVSASRVALLDAAMGSMIILHSIDAYLFRLASDSGLVNKRSRRVHPIVEQRQRVADSLARQLQALGLDRAPVRPQSLAELLANPKHGQDEPGDGHHGDGRAAL